jgi:hypothetical protein
MSASAVAQLPQPKLDWVFPPGGQRGTQVDITVGGTDLDEGRELVFSHAGLSALPKRSTADEFYPDGQPIANQFTMSIAADVPPGCYEAQVVGRHGVSSVRVVHVSDLVEVVDAGNNHAIEQAQSLTVGSLVNGRTEADQEDYYAIELAQGDELTCESWARRIDSQAEMWMEVCRADGVPLKTVRRWERRDPVLCFTAPAAGKYFIRVYDVTFRGGEPFIYQLAVHNQARIDYVMPPAALPNGEADFTLFGNRLAETPSSDSGSPAEQQRTVRVAIPGSDDARDARYPTPAEPREVEAERFATFFPQAGTGSNEVWIGRATSAVVTEQQPNDSHSQAQRLGVPGELVGQFFPHGDNDWIELQPDAAGEVVIDVFSQRLGLPTDPHVTISRVVKSPQGDESLEQVAEADSGEARPATPGFNTTSEDPYARLTLEKDTIYRVLVRDENSFSHADPSNVYRLVIRRPQPDFRLLAAPASPWAADPAVPLRWPLTVRAGDALAIPIVALRQDGFANEIVVSAEGLPPGLTCEPVTIRAGKTEAQLVLMADPQVTEWVGSIRIVGESQVGETRVRKVAAPASLVWDTTTARYDRARLNRQLVIALIPETAPISIRCEGAAGETNPGGVVKAKLAVSVRAELKEALSVAPIGLPEGVTAKFTLAEDKKSAELELTVGEKVAPGAYDFVVSGKPKVLYATNPEAAARASEDQARIAKLVEGFKADREQLVVAAGAAASADSPQIKQLDECIGRGEMVLKEAAERATKLAAAAQPAERQCYVVSNVATLRVTEKAKE